MRFSNLVPLSVVLVGTAALYAPVATFPFVNWDDPIHVYRNRSIVEPESVDWIQRWMPRELGYPMPMTMLSYRIDRALYGPYGFVEMTPDQGRGYHVTNLVLFMGLLVVVYRLCVDWTRHRFAAAISTLLFALHPLSVEPVAWISGRKDLLCALFSTSAMLFGSTALRQNDFKRCVLYLLCGLGALASKPHAIFIVPMMLVSQLWFSSRRKHVDDDVPPLSSKMRYAMWGSTLFLGLIATGLVWLSLTWQHTVGAVRSDSIFTTVRRSFWALGYHLSLLFSPTQLRPKYIVEPHGISGYDGIAAIVLVLLILAVLHYRRKQVAVAWGALWFLLAYLPVSNLIPLTRYIADTYLFLPRIGLTILIAFAIARIGATHFFVEIKPLRWGAIALVTITVFTFAGLSRAQLQHWQSSPALWRRALTFHPESPQLCRLYGHAFNETHHPQRALDVYHECAARFGMNDFAMNIAITEYMVGNRAEAKRLFESILKTHPNDERALKYLKQLK